MALRQVDVIVVGGGPAGLSAALMLGRCRHDVLLFDTGTPRNAASFAMHGYLTRDGMKPTQWLRLARQEVDAYGVRRIAEEVVDIQRLRNVFRVRTSGGGVYSARKVLMATGVKDNLPDIPGMAALYGKSVFHCPYCDGWEVRDRPLAAYGRRQKAVALALNLRTWSNDVVLFTDGPPGLRTVERAQLQRCGVRVCAEPVERLQGRGGRLQYVVLRNGERWPCAALFFSNGHSLQCTLPVKLGCLTARNGEVITDSNQRTGVAGLFVAGDASIDTHFISVACAEGAKAAVAIHCELRQEDGLL